MIRRPPTKMTIAYATYGIALKTAMRRSAVFVKGATLRQVVVILKLPPDADDVAYVTAAALLIKSTPELASFKVLRPSTTRKGVVLTETIDAGLDAGDSLILLWPFELEVPARLVAAADKIVDVGPVRPIHLVTAMREVHGQTLDFKDAEKLLRYPMTCVFAAMRAGRSLELVMDRLQESISVHPAASPGPRLTELEGYGEARDWGLALAEDLSSWRSREIPWSEVDRGILISGPPGSGKTLFASALARTCGIEVVATSVSRWQSMGHLGDMLGAMRKSFQEAVAKKPCILFLDELDSIGDRASFRGDHVDYSTQVVNGLLELVDGHDRLEGVVLVGATNFPERIDPALRRAGRLDFHVTIPLPDADTRKALCRRYLRDDMPASDIEGIVAGTVGFTGADFEKLGREVRRRARKGRIEITGGMVLGLLPPALKIEGGRRRTVAVHEAGHAIVGLHLEVGKLKSVVVVGEVRGQRAAAGYTHFLLNDEVERNRQTLLNQIVMLLGGRAAEEIILGSAFEGAGGEESDIHKATDLATLMDVQLGMGEALGYFRASSSADLEALRRLIPAVRERVEQVLQKQWKRARAIVERNVDVVEFLASQLAVRGHVDGAEVEQMMSTKLQEASP